MDITWTRYLELEIPTTISRNQRTLKMKEEQIQKDKITRELEAEELNSFLDRTSTKSSFFYELCACLKNPDYG